VRHHHRLAAHLHAELSGWGKTTPAVRNQQRAEGVVSGQVVSRRARSEPVPTPLAVGTVAATFFCDARDPDYSQHLTGRTPSLSDIAPLSTGEPSPGSGVLCHLRLLTPTGFPSCIGGDGRSRTAVLDVPQRSQSSVPVIPKVRGPDSTPAAIFALSPDPPSRYQEGFRFPTVRHQRFRNSEMALLLPSAACPSTPPRRE
jgi:hypothetical protein